MIDPLGDIEWKNSGKCYEIGFTVEGKDLWESFFADMTADRKPALTFCQGCKVQKRCLRFALETEEIWGVWGGRDESEIRRALWMNASGTIGARSKKPRCPWCKSKPETLEVVDEKTNSVQCSECDFSWVSATTVMGIFGVIPVVDPIEESDQEDLLPTIL